MLNSTRLMRAFILAAALLVGTMPVWGIEVFTDRTLWDNAVNDPFTLIDWEELGLPVGGVQGYSTSSGYTRFGTQFVGYCGDTCYTLDVINPQTTWGSYFASGALLAGPYFVIGDYNENIRVNFPAGTTAFGADLMSVDPNALNITIDLSSIGEGNYQSITLASPNRQFWGVTSTVPIPWATFALGGGAVNNSRLLMDNFVFGTAGGGGGDPPPQGGETPEVTTLLYVGTGVFLLAFTRRRMRSRLP